ncbi:MAG: PilN domain-containing protein, partial [Dehalococcoidia bacterium]|nr:PilN domain-containing protein [Dehalococcoidia bacterium]
GLIVDEHTFINVLADILKQVTRNGKLSGQKVAVAITGRNMVQRRLTVYVDDGRDLAEAIVNASSDAMSIRTEEMQIEWDADELDLYEDDEYEDDELEDGDEDVDPEESEETAGPEPEQTEEIRIENLDLDLEPEPDGDPYDVYAMALHKHVIRRNLRTVSDFGARFAGVQPKILALAAAVNSRAAIVLDIESDTLITAIVNDGLPEVIREVGIDRELNRAQWVNLLTTQISRAVGFYNSLFPEERLESDVEVFLTGQTEQARDAFDEALEWLPYVRAELPPTLRAPEEFPFEKYAANVGLVIVSGKRFWQRTPVPLLPTPKFDYRPAQYQPRPLPVRAALKLAVMFVLGFGLFGLYQAYTEQSDSVALAQRSHGILEQQVDLRGLQLEKTRKARIQLNEAKLKTERLIAANEVIQDLDAGFAETMAVVSRTVPDGVRLTTVDDDGKVVAVEAEATDYLTLLQFIRQLEDVPQFVHVQVLNLGTSKEDESEQAREPSEMTGGAVEVEDPTIKMSIEISRVEIEDEQSPADEELAVTGIGE